MKKFAIFLTLISILLSPYQSAVEGGINIFERPGPCRVSRGPSPVQVIDMGGCGYDASSRSVSLVATIAFAAIMTGIIFAIGFSNSAHVSHSE